MHEDANAESSVMETLAFILPIIAAASLVFLFGIMLYFRIRRTLPVRVNCWFCNKDTQVPYGNQNCWDCPSCEQYNGFLPDGSYNKAIPAQHDELLNHPVPAVPNKRSLPAEGKGNGLCRKCNINQELKVQQLATFTPVNPARYDEEVDEFRCHLERNYRLCSQCEKVLKQTLHKQKSWLLGLRMQQIRGSGVMNKKGAAVVWRSLRQLSAAVAEWAHGVTLVLATWLTLSTTFHLSSGQLPVPATISESSLWLAFPGSETIFPKLIKLLPLATVYETYITSLGAIAQLLVLFSKKRVRVDVICIFLWAVLCGQSWIKKWEKLEVYISFLHFIKIYMAVSSLNFILCLCAFLVPQQRKQMKVHNLSADSSINCSGSTFDISDKSECDFVPEDPVADEKIQKQEESVKLPEENIPNMPPQFRESCASDNTASFASDNSSSGNCTLSSTPVTAKSESLLDINFDSLSLDDCNKKNIKKSHSGLFQTKLYGSNSNIDLFTSVLSRENNTEHRSSKTPLLRPSQLNVQNHVTQSSWVAGGYWQSPKHSVSPTTVPDAALPSYFNFSPLSRSSSQSSGFVSQSSQPGPFDRIATSLPNSRTGSLCGAEFDRFSALSEPACHYPTSTSPFYATQRAGMVQRSCYRPSPAYVHGGFSMMPPSPPLVTGFCPPFTPQPFLQPSYYYPLFTSISTPPLSPIWNPAAFIPPYFKQPSKISPKATSEVRSHSSSHRSSISHGEASIVKPHTPVVRKSKTLVGALKENLFLTVCFYSSVVLSALVAVCAALMNTKLSLTGLV